MIERRWLNYNAEQQIRSMENDRHWMMLYIRLALVYDCMLNNRRRHHS
jgi:hypothetical protein